MPKKEVPYKLQKWNAIAGIAGAFIGSILSVWALIISIKTKDNATKIEKMDSLISLLNSQAQKPDSQLNELKNLQTTSI